MENCYYFCNRDGMNSEMPTLCNKFNFKSVIMKAILLENGIYIIRKTKCSTIAKQNDIFSKRNVYFFGYPSII